MRVCLYLHACIHVSIHIHISLQCYHELLFVPYIHIQVNFVISCWKHFISQNVDGYLHDRSVYAWHQQQSIGPYFVGSCFCFSVNVSFVFELICDCNRNNFKNYNRVFNQNKKGRKKNNHRKNTIFAKCLRIHKYIDGYQIVTVFSR